MPGNAGKGSKFRLTQVSCWRPRTSRIIFTEISFIDICRFSVNKLQLFRLIIVVIPGLKKKTGDQAPISKRGYSKRNEPHS